MAVDKKLMAKLEKAECPDAKVLKALPTQEQLKQYYIFCRPILQMVADFPLLPAKYVAGLQGLVSVADKLFGVK